MQVVGVDVCDGSWVAVLLEDGSFAGAGLFGELAAVTRRYAAASVVAVDIPIGLLSCGRRCADREARAWVGGGRASSVFFVPTRPVLGAESYEEARAVAVAAGEPKPSKQVYGLRRAIFEAEAVAAGDARVREIHPEASFRAMAGRPLGAGKKSWNGLGERLALLEREGIRLPRALPELGSAGIDDVVDAAAAAWTAQRIARGTAVSLPDPPEAGPRGERIAIWY
jgi:predicted RNase H-like nuclease